MIYDGKYAGTGREENTCLGKEKHRCENAARYCPVCGSMTVFFKKGLLRPFEERLNGRASDPLGRITPEEWEELGKARGGE